MIPKTGVVTTHPDTRDDADLATSMLLPRDPLRLLHQQRAEAAVLELARVPTVQGHGGAVHVQLADQTGLLARELGAEGVRGAALAEAEEADQDVLLGVLVGEEGLPAAVGGVVAPDELDLGGADLVLDLVDADLAGADVTAGGAEVFHPAQGEFAEVAVLDARGDEGHGDVSLDTVDTSPWRHESEDTGDDVDEGVGRVVLVAAGSPEFVETCAADDKRRVDLQTIGAEGRVFEVLAELVQIALHPDVGEVGHHVADNLETSILGQLERLRDGGNRVASVRVPRHILIQTLHTDLQSRASVAEHSTQMGIQAVVRTSFDRDTDALNVAHLTRLDGLVDIVGLVPTQRIVQLRYEPLPVVLWKRHKRSTHDDVFHLVDAVAQSLDLVHPSSSLFEGVIAGANRAH